MKTRYSLKNLALFGIAFGLTATCLTAAPVIHEPFAQTAGTLNSKAASSTGLTGNWTVGAGTVNVVNPSSMVFGGLLMSDGHANLVRSGNTNGRVVRSSALADAGLLDNGQTLWFSLVIMKTAGGGNNEWSGFAFGTSHLTSGPGTLTLQGGNGLGFRTRDTSVTVATWNGTTTPAVGGSLTLTYNQPSLIVGKIEWGATDAADETITLYKPLANLSDLGAGVSKTMPAVTQSLFNTISFSLRDVDTMNYDEIRFGATQADVMPVDTVAPTLLSITDDKSGGPIGEDVEAVTYTLTFDKHMDLSTITAADFDNAGSATATVGTVSQPSQTVIQVQLLPTTTGTLQLRIPASSELKSFANLALDTTNPILDDTTITIDGGTTPNTPGSNRWWDLATSGVTDGVSQGGTGTWDTTTTNWDRGAGFENPVAWDNSNGNTAIFGGTAGTVTLGENITLNGLTVSSPTAGASAYSIGNVGEDNTLTFTGGKTVTTTATGTGTNQDVIIRAGIAGAPTMNIAGRATNGAEVLSLLPGSGVTQTIGTINMLNTNSSNKRLILGGDSSGNVVDTVTWPTVAQQLMLTKAGPGGWTITNNVNIDDGRLYVERGTLTLGGTNNIFSHKVGVATTRETTFTASNQVSKLIAKGTFTILDNREYFYVQNLGTLSPGPGVETLTVRWTGTTSGTHAQFNMQTGSTYEWDIASATSTDIINVQRNTSPSGSLTLGNMTIKVNDAGVTTPILATDQLTVFTYQTGVTRSLGTVTIDTSALGAGWGGTPSLVDNGTGTIYITGLTFSGGATYTVTYDDNDSTSGTVPVDANTYATGAPVTVLGNTGGLVKTGFVFTGWNTQADGLGTHYNAGASFNMGSANVTLWADWRTPYQAWLLENSKTDTEANRREYAFGTANAGALVLNGAGTAIEARGQAPIITTTVGSAFVKLTYARRKNSGFSFSAQYSTDLETWLESNDASLVYHPDAPVGETIQDNGDEMEIVSINFPVFRDTGSGIVKMLENFCRIAVTP